MRLTREIMHQAVNKARKRGGCQYTDDQGTCCVAAHALEAIGVPIPKGTEPELPDGRVLNTLPVRAPVFLEWVKGKGQVIHEYESKILYELQCVWDQRTYVDQEKFEEDGRNKMRSIVDNYFPPGMSHA